MLWELGGSSVENEIYDVNESNEMNLTVVRNAMVAAPAGLKSRKNCVAEHCPDVMRCRHWRRMLVDLALNSRESVLTQFQQLFLLATVLPGAPPIFYST